MYINKHIHQASLKEVEPAGSLSNGDQVVYLNLTLRFISINWCIWIIKIKFCIWNYLYILQINSLHINYMRMSVWGVATIYFNIIWYTPIFPKIFNLSKHLDNQEHTLYLKLNLYFIYIIITQQCKNEKV